MIDVYSAIGIVAAIVVVSGIWAFITGASNTAANLTGVEKRFLAVLRASTIWSAGLSLVASLVLALLAVLSFLAPLLRTHANFSFDLISILGLSGGAALLDASLTCFGGFVASMLVFIFVAVELHLRRTSGGRFESPVWERREPKLGRANSADGAPEFTSPE